MLGEGTRRLSSQIATQLVEDGMLWGDELEWFIRCNLDGFVNLENDSDYDEVENKVLEYVELRRRKRLMVINVNTGDIAYFGSLKQVHEMIGVTYASVSNAIRNKTIVKKTYSISHERISIKQLSKL